MREAKSKALDALVTIAGQNGYNHKALVNLLVEKGIITTQEVSDEYMAVFLDKEGKKFSPAQWALATIDPEDVEALNAFFGE